MSRAGAALPRALLKAGREKSLARRHPWIYSGAIERVEGEPAPGDTVRLVDQHGRGLALAAFNSHSNIRARVWCWDAEGDIDAPFFAARITAAAARRGARPARGGVRLVNAEADGLPGVVVDRYATAAVIQLSSAGAFRWREAIVAAVTALPGVTAVYEKSDSDVLALEGMEPRHGLVHGSLPSTRVEFEEDGLVVTADLAHGHKTGYYLDQAENRARVAAFAGGARVLNAFCYSGGFTLHSLRAGAAAVLSIDSSTAALAAGRDAVDRNALDTARAEWVEADVFKHLRTLRDQARQFDLIVLDPPKFAPTAATAERAARGYKDINLLAFKLLAPGGRLATFSCSGGVDTTLFRKIVAGAALDAGVDAQVVGHFHAASDHPVALSFPEGEYLKGLLCQVP